MSFFDSKRVPEPEAISDELEVKAYSEATARAYLERLDDTCVGLAIRLGMHQGVILDVGTGPGQIAIKLAKRCPEVTVLGIDVSAGMIGEATEAAEREGLNHRVHFQVANVRNTRFKSEYFDGVLCNSVLHHVVDPERMLNEIARIVKKEGAVLVRDLRRPSLLSIGWHMRWFGRKYSGKMRELFEASVRSAYSYSEWRRLLESSAFKDSAQIVVRNLSHLSIERPAQPSLFTSLAAKREQREFLAETEGWRKGI